MTRRKGAKITQRQIDLAKRWNTDGLLSDAGLGAVLDGESNDPSTTLCIREEGGR